MVNLSSAMGGKFAEAAGELTEVIERIGPNPLGRNRSSAEVDEVLEVQTSTGDARPG